MDNFEGGVVMMYKDLICALLKVPIERTQQDLAEIYDYIIVFI